MNIPCSKREDTRRGHGKPVLLPVLVSSLLEQSIAYTQWTARRERNYQTGLLRKNKEVLVRYSVLKICSYVMFSLSVMSSGITND